MAGEHLPGDLAAVARAGIDLTFTGILDN